MANEPERPDIDYPCEWGFRLIGASEEALTVAVIEIVGDRPYRLEPSNSSRNGRWQSMRLTLEVLDEEDRLALYQGLGTHDAVRMVL